MLKTPLVELVPNRTTVSFRLECNNDMLQVITILTWYSDAGNVIDFRCHVNKGNLPILEPYMEVTLSRDLLPHLIHDMKTKEGTELHVAIDTMKECPLDTNSLERQYGKGQFS